MNSEVTLEQLRELGRKVTASLEAGHFGTATVEECRYNEAVHCYVRQLLTTPPASGEVVGVPREPTMGRGSMMDAGVAAARSHKEAKDIDPTFGMVRAIYAAMLSAAPKQAMGWISVEDRLPEVHGDYWAALASGSVMRLHYNANGKYWAGGITRDLKHPTHWQEIELPSPPEKAGG